MAFGLSRLRLSPSLFWSLTLPELSAMAGGAGARAGMTRAGLEGLMRRFPD